MFRVFAVPLGIAAAAVLWMRAPAIEAPKRAAVSASRTPA
jgi:hypothetical protein